MIEDEIKHRTITLPLWGLWTMKGIIALLFIACSLISAYLYGDYVGDKVYRKTHEETLQNFQSVQYEFAGITYCYDPRERLTRKAVYKGHGMYKVEDR